MSFGWYHEAYITREGKLFVCAKAKLSSIEVEGVINGNREDLHEVSTLPRGTVVKKRGLFAYSRPRFRSDVAHGNSGADGTCYQTLNSNINAACY